MMLSVVVAFAVPARSSALSNVPTVSSVPVSASLQSQPAKDLNIDINVNRAGGGAWYRSPVWIAIAVIAGVLVLLLLVLAVRGGGGGTTTVVR
jgi:hypothetical protein